MMDLINLYMAQQGSGFRVQGSGFKEKFFFRWMSTDISAVF
jgi:hypothetical protein